MSQDPTPSDAHMAAAEDRAHGKRDKESQLIRERTASAQEHMNASEDKPNASKGTMQKQKAGHSQLKEGDPEHRSYSEADSTSTTVSTNKEKGKGDAAADAAQQHAKQAGREAGAAASNAGTAIKEKTHDTANNIANKAEHAQEYAADKTQDMKQRASANYDAAKANVHDKTEQAKEYTQDLADRAKEKGQELSQKASEKYEAAKADLSEKAEHAKEYTQEMQTRAAAGLQTVKASIVSTAETIQHKAHDLSQAIKGTGKETTDAIKTRLEQASDYAKEHAPTTGHSNNNNNNNTRSGVDYDPVYDREGSLKADDSYTSSSHKYDQTPAPHTTVDGSNTPMKGDYDRPAPAPTPVTSAGGYERPSISSGGDSVLGVNTSVGMMESAPPSLPSQEANIGGYEGIQSRDAMAEGAHLASYVQDMSEL